MPGAHRDLTMWKPLQAEEMLKSFDMRRRNAGDKVENYKWMVPNEFKSEGNYYNNLNKNWHLNPRHTKPGKYGYNRSEVVGNLGNLQGQYDIAGGQVNPDFNRQINDLENYIMHNKRAPMMERSYKSNNTYHHVAGGPFYPGHSFVVHQQPMIEDRVVVNEFDIEWFIKQALRWDDLFVNSYNQIEDVKDRITKFLANFNGIYDHDVYRGGGKSMMTYFPWEDYEIFRVLENCRVNEEEMLLHLSRIPDDLLMYQVRWLKYQELMRVIIEIERWLYFLANEFKRPYNPPVILEEPKKPGSKYAGEFVVFWDYVLDIFKKVRDVQIVYGIYNRGSTVLKTRLVDNKPVENTQKTRFSGQAIFDISHLIKDVKAENESYLIFEVQGNPDGAKFNINSLGLDQGNGYPLREGGDKDGWDLFTQFDEGDQGMKTIGWSFIDLFDLKKEFKAGAYKVPIYLPPTMVDIDIKRFQQQAVRIPKTQVYLRLDYPDLPDIQNIDGCHLSYQHLYRIPDVHNFICKYAIATPGRDPEYKCPGIKCFVHAGVGFFPERKVRISWCVQIGKHVLSESEGVLCFYATSGLNPNTKKFIQDGNLPTDVIPFNEGKDWFKDFYDLIWTLWEKKLESDMYLIVQYLQLKENTIPSVSNVISRVLLEEEYDLLGYGVIKLNDKDGKLRFGDYRLDLHEGPIYIEDVDKHPKNGRYIWVSIAQSGTNIKARTPPENHPPSDVVARFQDKFQSKRSRKAANNNPPSQQSNLQPPSTGGFQNKNSPQNALMNKQTPSSQNQGSQGLNPSQSTPLLPTLTRGIQQQLQTLKTPSSNQKTISFPSLSTANPTTQNNTVNDRRTSTLGSQNQLLTTISKGIAGNINSQKKSPLQLKENQMQYPSRTGDDRQTKNGAFSPSRANTPTKRSPARDSSKQPTRKKSTTDAAGEKTPKSRGRTPKSVKFKK